MRITRLFPTDIMNFELTEYLPVLREMFNKIDFEQYKDDRYINGYTTYFNNYSYPKVDGFSDLINELENRCDVLAENQGVDMSMFRTKMIKYWFNRMEYGSQHGLHTHDEHYVGTFYVNCPDNSANIRYHNTLRETWENYKIPLIVKDNYCPNLFVDFEPQEGNVFMWNSWVPHEVLLNLSKTPRDSFSFNMLMVRK